MDQLHLSLWSISERYIAHDLRQLHGRFAVKVWLNLWVCLCAYVHVSAWPLCILPYTGSGLLIWKCEWMMKLKVNLQSCQLSLKSCLWICINSTHPVFSNSLLSITHPSNAILRGTSCGSKSAILPFRRRRTTQCAVRKKQHFNTVPSMLSQKSLSPEYHPWKYVCNDGQLMLNLSTKPLTVWAKKKVDWCILSAVDVVPVNCGGCSAGLNENSLVLKTFGEHLTKLAL